MTPIRGLTTPTNIEQPAPVVEKDRRAVAVPVPPKVKKIIGPCSWEAERPFLDRGPHAGLTWRKVDIEKAAIPTNRTFHVQRCASDGVELKLIGSLNSGIGRQRTAPAEIPRLIGVSCAVGSNLTRSANF